MDRMFDGAWDFDQPMDFDTRNVKYMNYMFRDTFMFNQNINSWDMRGVAFHRVHVLQRHEFQLAVGQMGCLEQ